jgi:hypothetical protein
MHKDHSRAISRAAAKGTFVLIGKLPALKTRKQPFLAAIAGFCFGGLGLGLYFLSWIDFVLPVVIWVTVIILSIPTAGSLTPQRS